MRQHEVIDHVRKTLSLYGHAQIFHVREVGSAQPTRRMLLGEEHLPGRAFSCTPVLHATLQRAQLPVLKTAGPAAADTRRPSWPQALGVIFQTTNLDIVPDLDANGSGRVRPCTLPTGISLVAAGQRADTFRAVFGSIPAPGRRNLLLRLSVCRSPRQLELSAHHHQHSLSVTNPPPPQRIGNRLV